MFIEMVHAKLAANILQAEYTSQIILSFAIIPLLAQIYALMHKENRLNSMRLIKMEKRVKYLISPEGLEDGNLGKMVQYSGSKEGVAFAVSIPHMPRDDMEPRNILSCYFELINKNVRYHSEIPVPEGAKRTGGCYFAVRGKDIVTWYKSVDYGPIDSELVAKILEEYGYNLDADETDYI
jgi:hypothetical protein